MKKFKYKYAKATARDTSIEKHFRDRYANNPNVLKYVNLGLPKAAPDGYYLDRKSKYDHRKYICIDGLCTLTSIYWDTDDHFRPNPVHIFMLDKSVREALIKSYDYLTEQMKYEVRYYKDWELYRELKRLRL